MNINTGQNEHGLRFLPVEGNQCLWMKTGMVEFKTCENEYDCTSCAFDKGIGEKLAQKSTSWRDVMRQPHLHKECRHMQTGLVIFHLCSHNYECKDCAYDQHLYEYDRLLCEEDLSAHAARQVNNVAHA